MEIVGRERGLVRLACAATIARYWVRLKDVELTPGRKDVNTRLMELAGGGGGLHSREVFRHVGLYNRMEAGDAVCIHVVQDEQPAMPSTFTPPDHQSTWWVGQVVEGIWEDRPGGPAGSVPSL